MTAHVASIAACFPEQLLWIGRGVPPEASRRRAVASSEGSCGPHANASSGTWALARSRRTVARCSSSPWCEAQAMAISPSPAPSRSAARRRNGSACRGLTQLRRVVSASGEPVELSTFPRASTTATCPRIRASTTVPLQTVASTGGAESLTLLTLTGPTRFWYGPAVTRGAGHGSPRAKSVSLQGWGGSDRDPRSQVCAAPLCNRHCRGARRARHPTNPGSGHANASQPRRDTDQRRRRELGSRDGAGGGAGQDRRRRAGRDAGHSLRHIQRL